MEYFALPGVATSLSRLTMGCEPLGGTDWGRYSMSDVESGVSRALELGVTSFDVADVYGLGTAERVLAATLGERRTDVVIATKCGVAWTSSAEGRAHTFKCLTPDYVRRAVEASLRRLQLSRIPLLFLHWPDVNTPARDTARAVRDLLENDLVGAIGVSNFDVDQLREIRQFVPVAAVQTGYSMLDREPEKALLPYCAQENIPVFAYGVLSQGLLTGKVRVDTKYDVTDRRHRLPHFSAGRRGEAVRIAELLRELGDEMGKSPAQIAIRWALEHPAVACVIAGAKSPRQMEENCGAMDWRLDRARLDERIHSLIAPDAN